MLLTCICFYFKTFKFEKFNNNPLSNIFQVLLIFSTISSLLSFYRNISAYLNLFKSFRTQRELHCGIFKYGQSISGYILWERKLRYWINWINRNKAMILCLCHAVSQYTPCLCHFVQVYTLFMSLCPSIHPVYVTVSQYTPCLCHCVPVYSLFMSLYPSILPVYITVSQYTPCSPLYQ